MSFGKRLKDARLACGNKQGVIADYLGITQTAYFSKGLSNVSKGVVMR